ncbi:MAG: hypothetical protein KC416_12455 [Myxococcales bacterium]|nr:hypothetical protein [Myxococcales bacterium]
MILDKIRSTADGARSAYDNLNERERKLALAMGGVFLAFLVCVPFLLVFQAISDVRTENEEMRAIIQDIASSGPEIAARLAKEEATAKKYEQPTPPLGTFLEAKAKEAGYDRALQTTDEPAKEDGEFLRRHTRASLQGIGLKAFLQMVVAVKNSPYPTAIERIQIENYRGGDSYNVEIGVFAYEKKAK